MTAGNLQVSIDPVMNAIVMQHRALRACNSCRKLKKRCTFNPTLGKCDRCSDNNKTCVYAEVNSTASHAVSTAVDFPSTSTASTNTFLSDDLNAPPHQHGDLAYLGSLSALSVTPNSVYSDQLNALSYESCMTVMGPGAENKTTYSPSHGGRRI